MATLQSANGSSGKRCLPRPGRPRCRLQGLRCPCHARSAALAIGSRGGLASPLALQWQLTVRLLRRRSLPSSPARSNQVQLSNHSSAHWSSRQWIHMSRCPYLCQLREKMPRGAKAREQRAGPTPVVGEAAWPLIAARRVHDRAILLVKSRSSKDPALSYGASSTEGLSLAHS
jgi:hypothetical protein